MSSFASGVEYTQAYGVLLCVHIGQYALYFGSGVKGRGPRIEICTPMRWFRYSRGYRDGGAK